MNELSAFAGIVLSLLFEYVPGFSDWYGGKEAQTKRLVMLACLFIAALTVWLLSCYGPLDTVACSKNGLWELATALFFAIAGNQSAHRLTKRD